MARVTLSERRKMRVFAGLGLICFVLLPTLEVITEGDELSLFDIAVDALSLLLTIGAAVGVGFVAIRVETRHAEKMALIRDRATTRAAENGRRNEGRFHLARPNGLQKN